MDITYDEARSNAEKIADEKIKVRVIAGMELLKNQYGESWVNHIDPDKLIMSDTQCCVLGQLYGSYFGMEREFDIHGEDYGFDADLYYDIDYGDLDEAWKGVLGGEG